MDERNIRSEQTDGSSAYRVISSRSFFRVLLFLAHPQPLALGNIRVGEGDVVTLVAFVFRAGYSDIPKSESVNCNLPRCIDNDIQTPQ
jgi:hypothetical protein